MGVFTHELIQGDHVIGRVCLTGVRTKRIVKRLTWRARIRGGRTRRVFTHFIVWLIPSTLSESGRSIRLTALVGSQNEGPQFYAKANRVRGKKAEPVLVKKIMA